MRIFKYEITPEGMVHYQIALKEMLKPIVQDGRIVQYALTSEDDEYQLISFIAVGTGWPIPNGFNQEWKYTGTVEDQKGYVWHIYWQYAKDVKGDIPHD